MCEMCTDQPIELGLHTTASAEQLWTRYQYVAELAVKAGDAMSEAIKSWREATDPEIKGRRYTEVEATSRECRVLSAWRELFYVAYIFTTDGPDAAVLDSSMPLHLPF